MRSRFLVMSMTIGLALSACSGQRASIAGPDLPTITPTALTKILEESQQPTVVNIWASWCGPCRSEAPLLREASRVLGGEVDFIGVAVADNQGAARAFIEEFDITFENYFDRNRAIPAALERSGVPITFFFDADGTLVYAHSGVIDERTLAVNIDEVRSP